MNRRFLSDISLLGVLLLFSCKTPGNKSALKGHAVPKAPKVFQEASVFQSNQPLAMTIEAPFKKVFAEAKAVAGTANADKPKFDALVKFVNAKGKAVTIAATGKTRGQRSTGCSFLKFKLEFKKDALADAPEFIGAEKLKFGTHCENEYGHDEWGGVFGEEKSYREAFIYRAGAILGESVARARPALITYVDTSDNNASITKQAFFFEDADIVAKRLGGKEIKEMESDISEQYAIEHIPNIDKMQLARALFFKRFAYDWDGSLTLTSNEFKEGQVVEIPALHIHNFEPYKLADGRVFIAASDFDMSSFVTMVKVVMKPAGGGSISTMTESEIKKSVNFIGIEDELGLKDLTPVFAPYLGKKDALLEELKSYPMDEDTRKVYKAGIEAFYEQIALKTAKPAK